MAPVPGAHTFEVAEREFWHAAYAERFLELRGAGETELVVPDPRQPLLSPASTFGTVAGELLALAQARGSAQL